MALFHGFIYDVILLFFIVFIHELGHACTAKAFGWRVRKIEILPFGGVASVDEHGNRPMKEEFLVVVAGPMMNVIMILFALGCSYLGYWQESFALQFIEYNLIIFLFNLLPIWPLDGGKMLQLGLSMVLPFRKAIRYSLLVSGVCFFVYLIIIALFFTYYFYLWIVGGFLLISQWLEWKQAHYQFMRFLIDRKQSQEAVEALEVLGITGTTNQLVYDLVLQMFRHKLHYFCILNERGEMEYVIHEHELLHQYFEEKKAYCTVGHTFG